MLIWEHMELQLGIGPLVELVSVAGFHQSLGAFVDFDCLYQWVMSKNQRKIC